LARLPSTKKTLLEVPLVGAAAKRLPFLGVCADAWIDSMRQRRGEELRQFLMDLAWDLRRLETRIGEKRLTEELEGAEFEQTLGNVANAYVASVDETKREFLKKYIVNTVQISDFDIHFRQIFERLLRIFSGSHIVALGAVWRLQRLLSDNQISVLMEQLERSEVARFSVISRELRIEKFILHALIANLEAEGVLQSIGRDVGNEKCLFLTPLGRKFAEALQYDEPIE